MIGCSVQSGAWSTDIVGSRCFVVVCSVAIGGYLESTHAFAGCTALRTVVWVLCVVWCSTLVVCIEGASGRATLLGATRLLTSDLASSSEKSAVNTRLVNNPGEG
jgi:hypothetical protein